MNTLSALVFSCLAACAMASLLAPAAVVPGALHYGAPLALSHYAAGLPVGRAVTYGSTINHGVVSGYGLAPYGLRYGLGLAAAPLAPAAVGIKYGVAAAPLAHTAVGVKYGLAAAPLAVAAPYAYGYGLNKGYAL